MLQKWQKISSEVFHENKWWKGIHDRFRLPNGKEGDYFYIKTSGGVLIVAQDSEGKILMHREYRYLIDKISLSFPGGGVKIGQSPLEAAVTELAEEVGVSGNIKEVGFFAANCGLTDEIDKVFVASDLEPILAEKDETEDFELVRLSINEVEMAIINGEIWNAFDLAGWVVAKPYLKVS
jgi:ADP-ribose pyrophosphatase